MSDSLSTSADTALTELPDSKAAISTINATSLPGNRVDSPASVLQGTYSGRSGGTVTNQSSEAIDKFSKFLGFSNENKYDFNYRSFPSDLGSEYNSHYMIININVQVDRETKPRTNIVNSTNFQPANYTPTTEASRVDKLRNSMRPSLIPNSIGDLWNTTRDIITDPNAVNLPRSTRKIKEAIALYMPMPTVYTHTNVYEEVSLTAFGAQALKLGGTFFGKTLQAALAGRLAAATSSAAPNIINAAGQLIRRGATAAGMPINPKIEVLFSHTPQRSFRMEILMAPKNEKESETVKNIIDTLRFHAAPEIDSVAGFIPIFIPPAEFDITFYHKGKINNKIPLINTCALEQIEVDYAPTGVYSTFANGHPVAIRLSLAFRELEILHKQRVVQGF